MPYVRRFYYMPRANESKDTDVLLPCEKLWKFEGTSADCAKDDCKKAYAELQNFQDLPDSEQKKQLQFKGILGILNKLTPKKFQKLVWQIGPKSVDLAYIEMLAQIIFSKALVDEIYVNLYVQLCEEIMPTLPPDSLNKFRQVFIDLCQTGFGYLIELTDGDISSINEEKRYVFKRRLMALMRFIGEMSCIAEALFDHQYNWMLAEKLINKGDELHLEALYGLLFTCSLRSINFPWTQYIEKEVERLSGGYSLKGVIPHRIKFQFVELKIFWNNETCRFYIYDHFAPLEFYYCQEELVGSETVNNTCASAAGETNQILIGIFPDSRDESTETIFFKLKENICGLNVHLWKTVRRSDLDSSVQLTFAVDGRSLDLLKGVDYSIGYKSSRVRLKLLGTTWEDEMRLSQIPIPYECDELKTVVERLNELRSLDDESLPLVENESDDEWSTDLDESAFTVSLGLAVKADDVNLSMCESNSKLQVNFSSSLQDGGFIIGDREKADNYEQILTVPNHVTFSGIFPNFRRSLESVPSFGLLLETLKQSNQNKITGWKIIHHEILNEKESRIFFCCKLKDLFAIKESEFKVEIGLKAICLEPYNNTWANIFHDISEESVGPNVKNDASTNDEGGEFKYKINKKLYAANEAYFNNYIPFNAPNNIIFQARFDDCCKLKTQSILQTLISCNPAFDLSCWRVVSRSDLKNNVVLLTFSADRESLKKLTAVNFKLYFNVDVITLSTVSYKSWEDELKTSSPSFDPAYSGNPGKKKPPTISSSKFLNSSVKGVPSSSVSAASELQYIIFKGDFPYSCYSMKHKTILKHLSSANKLFDLSSWTVNSKTQVKTSKCVITFKAGAFNVEILDQMNYLINFQSCVVNVVPVDDCGWEQILTRYRQSKSVVNSVIGAPPTTSSKIVKSSVIDAPPTTSSSKIVNSSVIGAPPTTSSSKIVNSSVIGAPPTTSSSKIVNSSVIGAPPTTSSSKIVNSSVIGAPPTTSSSKIVKSSVIGAPPTTSSSVVSELQYIIFKGHFPYSCVSMKNKDILEELRSRNKLIDISSWKIKNKTSVKTTSCAITFEADAFNVEILDRLNYSINFQMYGFCVIPVDDCGWEPILTRYRQSKGGAQVASNSHLRSMPASVDQKDLITFIGRFPDSSHLFWMQICLKLTEQNPDLHFNSWSVTNRIDSGTLSNLVIRCDINNFKLLKDNNFKLFYNGESIDLTLSDGSNFVTALNKYFSRPPANEPSNDPRSNTDNLKKSNVNYENVYEAKFPNTDNFKNADILDCITRSNSIRDLKLWKILRRININTTSYVKLSICPSSMETLIQKRFSIKFGSNFIRLRPSNLDADFKSDSKHEEPGNMAEGGVQVSSSSSSMPESDTCVFFQVSLPKDSHMKNKDIFECIVSCNRHVDASKWVIVKRENFKQTAVVTFKAHSPCLKLFDKYMYRISYRKKSIQITPLYRSWIDWHKYFNYIPTSDSVDYPGTPSAVAVPSTSSEAESVKGPAAASTEDGRRFEIPAKLEGHIVAILPDDFPNSLFDLDQLSMIENFISLQIQSFMNLSVNSFKPRLISYHRFNGWLLVTCQDDGSMTWLRNLKIRPWSGACIKCI